MQFNIKTVSMKWGHFDFKGSFICNSIDSNKTFQVTWSRMNSRPLKIKNSALS